MKIVPTFPVIGPMLYRRSVKVIAGDAGEGDAQAVRTLAGIATTSSDASARAIALDALHTLRSQDAIDAFCNEVLALGDRKLETIAVTHGYIPSEPGLRALFLYITGQEETLCRFDPDAHHPILACGYAAAPEGIKARTLRSASDTRMGRILARALIGADPVHSAGTWSYGEWEVVTASLTVSDAWDVLWLLVFSAPPSLAVVVLNDMKSSGWTPGGDGRLVFEELVRDLPESWACPAPEKPLLSIGNHDSRSLRLAFSRDGTLLATGNGDGRMVIWQVSSARLLASITTNAGSIGFLAFTPDNSCLISGGNNGTLNCSAIPSGNKIWSYADKNHQISSIAMSGNGEEIIAGDERGGLIRIGCLTGKTLQVLQVHPSPVTALSSAPEGKAIALGHADGTICCCDVVTGTEMWTVPGTGDAIRALAFTEHADQLFVVHERSLPVLRDGRSGELVWIYAGYSSHPACHAISADRRIAAIGGDDHILRLWNLTEKNPAAEVPFYSRLATCCAMTPDGTLLAAGCNEGTVYFFSVPDGRRIKEFREYKRPVSACTVSPDSTLLATAGWDGTVTLRGIPSGELLRTLRRPAGAVTALALTSGAGGTMIVAGTADGTARLFSREDGSLVRSIDLYTPSVRTLAISHDGTYLTCAGSDATLRIWDLPKGSLVTTCDGLTTTVRCLAFLPDATACISGGWEGVARIWSVPDGKPTGTLPGHSSTLTCCCLDQTGQVLVTVSNDTTVRIWELAGEKKSTVIRDAKKEVSCCAISRDSTLLATAGPDPVIRLYHLPGGTAAGTVPQVPGKPTALAFTDDDLAIVAGYETGILAFYSVYGRSLIRTLPAHAGAVTGIVAVPGDDSIITSGLDGMIRIFRLPFMRPLSQTTLADLYAAREQEQAASLTAVAEQWRFLHRMLSIRFQNEIELCLAFRDAGMYDIQIVG
ncbi:MAG: WD40 repeat domain-containing protein [Methanoregula sp.]|jgi:WD40 repeat protein|uniref:WD40 repeat domain-containing protein n=1 Tax=Methanoregula sp. TaxID=2052170 RepID=UPI003C15B17F